MAGRKRKGEGESNNRRYAKVSRNSEDDEESETDDEPDAPQVLHSADDININANTSSSSSQLDDENIIDIDFYYVYDNNPTTAADDDEFLPMFEARGEADRVEEVDEEIDEVNDDYRYIIVEDNDSEDEDDDDRDDNNNENSGRLSADNCDVVNIDSPAVHYNDVVNELTREDFDCTSNIRLVDDACDGEDDDDYDDEDDNIENDVPNSESLTNYNEDDGGNAVYRGVHNAVNLVLQITRLRNATSSRTFILNSDLDNVILDESLSEGVLSLESFDDEELMENPLTSGDIDLLPTRVYRKRGELTDTCNICISEYNIGDEIRTLPCWHDFHSKCVDVWLMKNGTCPVCRATVEL